MIEATSLLNQMEQLVQKAKQNPTDANIREQLTAVRALCDVVLHTQGALQTAPPIIGQETFMQQAEVQQPRTMPKRAEIEQQNDSIFDF